MWFDAIHSVVPAAAEISVIKQPLAALRPAAAE